MADIEMVDKTGQLPTQKDFDDALEAISSAMLGGITKLPPELALSMPVIHRCLKAGRAVFAKIEAHSK